MTRSQQVKRYHLQVGEDEEIHPMNLTKKFHFRETRAGDRQGFKDSKRAARIPLTMRSISSLLQALLLLLLVIYISTSFALSTNTDGSGICSVDNTQGESTGTQCHPQSNANTNADIPASQPYGVLVPKSDFLGLVKRSRRICRSQCGNHHPRFSYSRLIANAYPECQPNAKASQLSSQSYTFTLSRRPLQIDPLCQPPFLSKEHGQHRDGNKQVYVYPKLQPRWRTLRRGMQRTRSFHAGVKYILSVHKRGNGSGAGSDNNIAVTSPEQYARRAIYRSMHYIASAFQSIRLRHANRPFGGIVDEGVKVYPELVVTSSFFDERIHRQGDDKNAFNPGSVKLRLRITPPKSSTASSDNSSGENVNDGADAAADERVEMVGLNMEDWHQWDCPSCFGTTKQNESPSLMKNNQQHRQSYHHVKAQVRNAAYRTVSIVQLAEMYASMYHRDQAIANDQAGNASGNDDEAAVKPSEPRRGVVLSVSFPLWTRDIARALFINAIRTQARLHNAKIRQQEQQRSKELSQRQQQKNDIQQASNKYTLIKKGDVKARVTTRVRITRSVRQRVKATLERLTPHLVKGEQPALPKTASTASTSALIPRSDNKIVPYTQNNNQDTPMYLKVERLTETIVIQEVLRMQQLNTTLVFQRNHNNNALQNADTNASKKQMAFLMWQHRVRRTPAYREFIRLTAYFDALVGRPHRVITKGIGSISQVREPNLSQMVCVTHPGFTISLPFELLRKAQQYEQSLKNDKAKEKATGEESLPDTIIAHLNRLRLSVVRSVKRVVKRVVTYIPLPESIKQSLVKDSNAETQAKPGVEIISITNRPLREKVPSTTPTVPPTVSPSKPDALHESASSNDVSNSAPTFVRPMPEKELRRRVLERDHRVRARRQQMDAERQRRIDQEDTSTRAERRNENESGSAGERNTAVDNEKERDFPKPINVAVGPEALAGIPNHAGNRWISMPRARESAVLFPELSEGVSSRRYYRHDGTPILSEDQPYPQSRSERRRQRRRNKLKMYKDLGTGPRVALIIICAVAAAIFLYAFLIIMRALLCPSDRQRARDGSQMILDEDVEVIVRQDAAMSAQQNPSTAALNDGVSREVAAATGAQPLIHPVDTRVHAPSQADIVVAAPAQPSNKSKKSSAGARSVQIPSKLRNTEAGEPLMNDYAPSPTHHAPVMPSLLDTPVTHIAIQPGSARASATGGAVASPNRSSVKPMQYSGPESHAGQQISTPTSLTKTIGDSPKSVDNEDEMNDSDMMTDDDHSQRQPSTVDASHASLLTKRPDAVEQLRQQNKKARQVRLPQRR